MPDQDAGPHVLVQDVARRAAEEPDLLEKTRALMLGEQKHRTDRRCAAQRAHPHARADRSVYASESSADAPSAAASISHATAGMV